MARREWSSFLFAFLLVSLGARAAEVAPADHEPEVRRGAVVTEAVHHDTSPPLFLLRPVPETVSYVEYEPIRSGPRENAPPGALALNELDVPASPATAPDPTLNFLGVGTGFSGPGGGFVPLGNPSDTSGDVGPNHYVQIVNQSFAVFDKATGMPIFGPVQTNTLFSGFGGPCETTNAGDGIVLYDPLADRWLVSQFTGGTGLECVAISQSADPTGAWSRYAFAYGGLPDYPKFGVWPDAYYVSFNLFPNGGGASQGLVCAYDRAKMLAGAPATQQCFNVGAAYTSLLPSDLDGRLPPPPGAPNTLLAKDWTSAQTLYSWSFHVDWATSANTALTGPVAMPFSIAATDALGSVPQAGTTNRLDNLSDRLMYRLAYRNFGTYQSLTTTRGVRPNPQTATAGIDWLELRLPSTPGQPPTIFQEGHYYSPAGWAWMASAAMDQAGNLAMGYSVSSSSIYPQIRYTGRLSDDPLGQMTIGEGLLMTGGGWQNDNRWGDYSTMAVDPSDDCTFWYTTEYIGGIGAAWSTRVGSFRLPGCPPPLVARSNGPVCAGASIQFSATGPLGASFAWTGPNGFSSTLANPTIAGATTAASGNYAVTCSFVEGSCGSVSVAVAVVPNGGECSDGNSCTLVDTCQAGTCVGASPLSCASLACSAGGTCDPATGLCSVAADGVACDDGNACVGGDACRGGLCVADSVLGPVDAALSPYPTALSVGELTGDGIPDLIVVGGVVSVQAGVGDGTFTTQAYPPYVGSAPVAAAQVGPPLLGKPAFAIADRLANAVWVYVRNNFGLWDAVAPSIPAGNGPSAMVAADFNGDGRNDLAIADRDGNTVTILTGTAISPYFVSGGAWTVGAKPTSIASGDLNLDGRPDLVVASADSRDVTILLNTGSGFAVGMGSPLGAGRSPAGVVVADFDGDGRPDVAVVNERSSDVNAWMNRATAGFVPAPRSPFAAVAPRFVAAGDLNLDGHVDLAVLANASGTVRAYLGDGKGRFAASAGSPITVGADPLGLVAGDLNFDGVTDLVVGMHSDGILKSLLGAPSIAPDGSACTDGNPCLAGDTCAAGVCVSGDAPPDVDADGHLDDRCGGDDCNDSDGSVWHAPASVSGLVASGKSPTSIQWSELGGATGPGTVYDLASGPLSSGGDHGFSSASCLQSGGGASYSDGSPDPAPGSGVWYLSRARNSCATATYGTPQADASIAACP
jgi:hypothetical protein